MLIYSILKFIFNLARFGYFGRFKTGSGYKENR